MTSEIDKLKHFHVENYSGIYFTDELNAGEEFLYTTIGIKDDKEITFLCKYIKNKHIEACPNCVFNNRFRTTKNTEAIVFENGGFVGNLGLVKKLWKKYTEAIYKYRTNTGKMTASDYTHLFGYLNPYYRSAYNIPKRRK
mgnify:CR=1 FL=1|jgi:hypothetical protein